MTDHGPHSPACADAEGGDCHCDCHGTMHGIGHLAGPVADRMRALAVTPVKAGGKVTHYQVIHRSTGLPPGGGSPVERRALRAAHVTVTATSRRPRTLPAPVAAAADRVRASLPKDTAGWAALVPRKRTMRDYHREQAASSLELAEQHDARRQATVDAITASMKENGYTAAQIRKETVGPGRLKYLDIAHNESMAEHYRKAHAEHLAAAETADDPHVPDYPRDKSGLRVMPTVEQQHHLDAVLDVGRQALDAIHEVMNRDGDLAAARGELGRLKAIAEKRRAVLKDRAITAGQRLERLGELDNEIGADKAGTRWLENAEKEVARRESDIIREHLANHRPMGGVHHTLTAGDSNPSSSGSRVTAARADYEARVRTGESYYPDDWLRRSAAQQLRVVTSERAFYSPATNTVALSDPARDSASYRGAYRDETDEVTVHELGHRMEQMVPGLTALEFAFVRRRSTMPDGTLEQPVNLRDKYQGGGYEAYETAFEDEWAREYAGKTYEASYPGDPATIPWEVFQVGTQDLFGRSRVRYDKTDELQAFTLGVLLTLA